MFQSIRFSPFPWRRASRVEPDGSVQVLDREGRPCGIRLDPKKDPTEKNQELAVASPYLYLALRALKSAVLDARKSNVPAELLGPIARKFDEANDDADLALSLVEDSEAGQAAALISIDERRAAEATDGNLTAVEAALLSAELRARAREDEAPEAKVRADAASAGRFALELDAADRREYAAAFAKKTDAGFKADARASVRFAQNVAEILEGDLASIPPTDEELRLALRNSIYWARNPGPDAEYELQKYEELLRRPSREAVLQDPGEVRLVPTPIELLAGELADRLRGVLVWARVYAKLYQEFIPVEARPSRKNPAAAIVAAEETLRKIDVEEL